MVHKHRGGRVSSNLTIRTGFGLNSPVFADLAGTKDGIFFWVKVCKTFIRRLDADPPLQELSHNSHIVKPVIRSRRFPPVPARSSAGKGPSRLTQRSGPR